MKPETKFLIDRAIESIEDIESTGDIVRSLVINLDDMSIAIEREICEENKNKIPKVSKLILRRTGELKQYENR